MGLFRRKDAIISPTQPPQVASLNGVPAGPTKTTAPTTVAAPAKATRSTKRSAASRPAGAAPDLRFTVTDVFTITGRGTVATGHVDDGWVRVRGEVEVLRGGVAVGTWRVTAIERADHQVSLAQKGVDVGLLFKRAHAADLQRGDVLRAPAGLPSTR